ncbi:MAG TPA: discoidin domain-containing protein, partial [Sedimentisphaerales bacterium]|nr:discoidin domain-containing protein [Sedimentisphaerales bacterium]HRV49898.1 discoidin domain-containing protein [Sedimentisphaerales bacterium]
MWRKHVEWVCLAAALAACIGRAVAAGPEPLVYYPFDQLDGVVLDASGNGNDGTPNGGVQFEPAGYAKGCYSFNGSDSYVQLTRPVQDSFTLAAWIKTDVTGLAGTQAYQGNGLFWSDVAGVANDFVVAVLGTKLSFFNGNPDTSVNSNGDIVTGEWVHIAAVRDTTARTISVYIDGALDNRVSHSNTGPLDAQPNLAIGANTLDSRYYNGLMDEVKIYDVPLTESEVRVAMKAGFEMAADPSPADGQVDVPRDVVLSWTAGEFAASHDVYFGTSFADVNTAGRGNPLGVLASQDQSGTTYDPAGVLAFGQTYYWRVDEVNAAPDHTIFKGDVWSFTVEPLAYPITNIVATSNASSEEGAGPENTINGSGLNANDQHSTLSTDMWVGAAAGEPVWIQYEFDKVYLLHELRVWNYNVQFELMLGFGFKDTTIEYSENGVDWTTFADVRFAQATAKGTYTANTTVDLSGVAAKFVRLTAQTGWGLMGQFGLSEVRFLYIPVQAREPQP